MAHAAMAANCPGFKHALEHDLDPKFRKVLVDAGFDNALQWASTFESVANSAGASRELHEMLLALGATAQEAVVWLGQATEIYTLACDLAPSAHRRVGSLHGLALSTDLETHRRAGLFRKEKEDLRKLEVAALTDLPTAWRGKVYRRTESADTAHKRE